MILSVIMIILVGVEISIKKNRTYELINELASFFFFFRRMDYPSIVFFQNGVFFLGLLKKSLVF